MGPSEQMPIQRGRAWLSAIEGRAWNKVKQRQGMALSIWPFDKKGEGSHFRTQGRSTADASVFGQFCRSQATFKGAL